MKQQQSTQKAPNAFAVIFPRGRSGGYFPILNSGGYAARYLNPKTSMWISADPAMGDYIPVAPNSDEARRRNNNLPGMGGVFNYVNHHVYHYAGNNPVKYTDPDGRRNVPSANILKMAQDIVLNLKTYQQGGGGRNNYGGSKTTFCNFATEDLAKALGFNMKALLGDADSVIADQAATNLANAAKEGLITELDGQMAQAYANLGYLVIAASKDVGEGHGHLSTVRPSEGPYNSKDGPLIANVGASSPFNRHGKRYAIDAFGAKAFKATKYYFDPNQTFDYDFKKIAPHERKRADE